MKIVMTLIDNDNNDNDNDEDDDDNSYCNANDDNVEEEEKEDHNDDEDDDDDNDDDDCLEGYQSHGEFDVMMLMTRRRKRKMNKVILMIIIIMMMIVITVSVLINAHNYVFEGKLFRLVFWKCYIAVLQNFTKIKMKKPPVFLFPVSISSDRRIKNPNV